MYISSLDKLHSYFFPLEQASLFFSLQTFIKLVHFTKLEQDIWDEVGESDGERDKMLLQIEQDCLDVYKRKVEQAAISRAQLLQALSDAKVELSSLQSALGEKISAGIVRTHDLHS